MKAFLMIVALVCLIGAFSSGICMFDDDPDPSASVWAACLAINVTVLLFVLMCLHTEHKYGGR